MTLEELFAQALGHDKFLAKVLGMLAQGKQQSREISLAEFSVQNGHLYYRNRRYVSNFTPLQLWLMQEHHENPLAGHSGRSKTLELLQWGFYWKEMRRDVDQFVRNCHICQWSHTLRHAPFGILRPLPIPGRPWQDISIDFVVGYLGRKEMTPSG